ALGSDLLVEVVEGRAEQRLLQFLGQHAEPRGVTGRDQSQLGGTCGVEFDELAAYPLRVSTSFELLDHLPLPLVHPRKLAQPTPAPKPSFRGDVVNTATPWPPLNESQRV